MQRIPKSHVRRIQVEVRKFKGNTYLDIRNYYLKPDTESEWLPTKQGISILITQLSEVQGAIAKELDEYNHKLERAIEESSDD